MSAIASANTLGARAELRTDVLVVGSGSGGAVAACTLAEAGREVLILEEGPYVPPEVYGAWRPSESLRHIWRDGGMTAVIGTGGSPLVNMAMGRCVGGSSVLTGGVCFRTPEHVLHEWSHDLGLTELSPKGMEPHFERVEASVHVSTVPRAMWSRGTHLFARGAAARGFNLEPLRRNTVGCEGCGRCNFGCPHQHKISVDLSYLPRAFAAGARLFADCIVDRVLIEGGRAVGVAARTLDPAGRTRGHVTVRANTVVIAAGAAHSPLILRRSGVGRRSKQVGRNMTVHPSFKMMGRFDEPVFGWKGSLQAAFSTAFEAEGITLVGVFIPPSVIIASLPGSGATLTERAAQLPYLAMFGGLVHDLGGGRVRPGPGREPLMTYHMAKRDRATIPKMFRIMAETFFAAGAREVYLPILGLDPVTPDSLRTLDLERVPMRQLECTSQHPLGTCRMGVDPKRSVVDPEGKVWDLDGLWIADGSIVPTSLGVNPQISVMAMADRVAERVAQRIVRR